MAARETRIDLRATVEAKQTIESAAQFLGTTTSAFVLESAMEKAVLILQRANTIQLDEEESRQFLDVLDNPPEPNEHLIKLLAKHKDIK